WDFNPPDTSAVRHTLRAAPPCASLRYSRPRGWSRLRLVPSRHRRYETRVLTFHTKAWSSFAPPTCRMPLGQYQGTKAPPPSLVQLRAPVDSCGARDTRPGPDIDVRTKRCHRGAETRM